MRRIVIEVREPRVSGGNYAVSASIVEDHRSSRGLKPVALATITRGVRGEFATRITEQMMRELVSALSLVVNNFYETDQLPWGDQ